MNSLHIIPSFSGERNRGNLLFPVVICLCVIIVIEHLTRVQRFLAWGLSAPWEIYSTGYVIAHFIAALAGSITFGTLFFSVSNTRSDAKLSPQGYFIQKITEKSLIYTVLASIIAIFLYIESYVSPQVSPFASINRYRYILSEHHELYAWIICLILSLIAYIVLICTTSWQVHIWLLSPLSFALLAVNMTGNAAQGRNHDLATEAQIVCTIALGIALGYIYSWQRAKLIISPELHTELVTRVKLVSGIALIATFIGESILVSIYLSHSWHITWFFVLSLCIIIMSVLAVFFPLCITPVMIVIGLAELQDIYPAPANTHPDLWDRLLGFHLHNGPTYFTIVTHCRIDLLFLSICLISTILYLRGVHIIKSRGDSWSPRRTFSWICGVWIMFIFTCTGFNAYGSAQFSVHMIVHMALNMFVPVILVLGAPVTVILKVFSAKDKDALPGPREFILGIVHSKFAEIITNPIASVLIFVFSLYGLYFTPIFSVLVPYAWGHELMDMHFIISGYLLYWSVVGVDPGPKRMQFLPRLGIVFVLMPFHAFFGVATMNMRNHIIGGNFYASLAVPWIHKLSDDQSLAGGIAWATSEIPIVLVILSLLWQWYKQDQRDAKRLDRSADEHYDQDYELYNDMLQKLARGEG